MKKEFHKQITGLAVECALNSKGFNEALSADRIDLEKGSSIEDDVSLLRLSTLHRLLNWHFYGRRLGLFPNTPLKRTSLPRLMHLITQLRDSEVGKPAEGETRAVIIGRILHQIQDMSCPPHVIPVYHVSKDLYEAHRKLRIGCSHGNSGLIP
jgi:hypothetical protein